MSIHAPSAALAVPDQSTGLASPHRGIYAAQDVSVDEAEIRSKYDAGTLAKVSPITRHQLPIPLSFVHFGTRDPRAPPHPSPLTWSPVPC